MVPRARAKNAYRNHFSSQGARKSGPAAAF
jgi:hypothetical protein